MKIRLKVSVKVRGGRIFVPGVYDSENEGYAGLFSVLTGNESSDVLDIIDAPSPILEEEVEEKDEETEETESDETEEVEETEEEKPKKKKKKKRVI